MYYGERFNSFTHLVGTALAIAGAVVLIVMASLEGNAWKIVSFALYGATLILLYSASTLYHSTHCRHLYALCTGFTRWRLGLVALWRYLGLGDIWYRARA
jgi:channel protein (hemolysin III family)